MKKAVLISIQPEWCELIANSKKTVEVRKTRPKLDTPFKVYIYCTKGEYLWLDKDRVFLDGKYNRIIDNTPERLLNGKVIGEFLCHSIVPISITYSDPNSRIALREFPCTCLTDKEIMDYLGNGKTGYGWLISDLVIYDEPKELSEFERWCSHNCGKCKYFCDGGLEEPPTCEWNDFELVRPPQSWCYVEELSE